MQNEYSAWKLTYDDIMKFPEPLQTEMLISYREEIDLTLKSPCDAIVSDYLFTGSKVEFYPILTERKCRKSFTCAVSGKRIGLNISYITYKAVIVLPEAKEVYVTPEIKFLPKYVGSMPLDYQAFEAYWYNLNNDHSLEESFESEINDNKLVLKRLK